MRALLRKTQKVWKADPVMQGKVPKSSGNSGGGGGNGGSGGGNKEAGNMQGLQVKEPQDQGCALTGLALAADCGRRRVNAHLGMSVCMSTRHLKRVRPTRAVALECRGCLANQPG